jgi:hypothetical protein
MALVIKKKVIAKKTVKKAAKKVTRDARKNSISELMRQTLGKNINYPYAKLKAMVKARFPKSKWDETHYAWYKSRIAAGKLKGIK